MKRWIKYSKQVIAGVLCGLIVQCPVFLLQTYGAEMPKNLCSTGAVLMDADSGRVLFSKNGDEPYAMASTTKIMTCILALEYGKPEQVVTFSDTAAAQPDVQMNGKSGEQYYLKDLLYSMMLESHNDSSVAIAEAIGGDVKKFVEMMDQKAEAIGCEKTNFVTPNGLDGTDEQGDHCTSAKDLAKILRYCMTISSKASEFLEITGTQNYEFQELNGKRSVYCQNHNALLNSYEGALTGKTGFTGKAGYCYTAAARRGEETLIITLLGSGWYPHRSYKWADAKKLLDYGFDNYNYIEVGKKQWDLPEIPVENGMEETVSVTTDAGIFPYLLRDDEAVQCRIECAEKLQAPVEENTLVGNIFYELHGQVIEQFSIYTAEKIEQSTFRSWVRKYLRNIQDFVLNMTKK